MRNKLIELIEEVVVEYIMPINLRARVFSAHIADHLIANGATLQQWIPVSERLPSHKESVLVLTDDGYICVAYYYVPYEQWFGESGYRLPDGRHFITHWMPLPEPPKGE